MGGIIHTDYASHGRATQSYSSPLSRRNPVDPEHLSAVIDNLLVDEVSLLDADKDLILDVISDGPPYPWDNNRIIENGVKRTLISHLTNILRQVSKVSGGD